jgi:hypothetical protein
MLEGLRILVAEDDLLLAEVVVTALDKAGCVVMGPKPSSWRSKASWTSRCWISISMVKRAIRPRGCCWNEKCHSPS